MSNAINRKPLGFDYFRRLKKSWRRGRAIEYALIALLIAFTAFQVLLAVGAKAIKSAGGLVLAQDEATSVIFGMPAEAIKVGAVDQVLAIDDIYAAIEKRVIGICKASPVGVR